MDTTATFKLMKVKGFFPVLFLVALLFAKPEQAFSNAGGDSTHFKKGVQKLNSGDFISALLEFDQAANEEPQNADVFYNRGLVKMELGDNQSAIEDFDQAITLKKSMIAAYLKRGHAKANIGDHRSAIEDFKQVVLLDKKNLEALMSMAHSKYLMSDYPGAIEDYTQAIQNNMAHNFEAYYNRGLAYNEYGKFQDAIKDFTKVIELYPKYNYAFFYRAYAKDHLDDVQGAIQDYTKVIQLDPLDQEAYFNRGMCKVKLEDHQGAIADFTKAIEINPKFEQGQAYLHRAVAKYNVGDTKGSEEDFNYVVELFPHSKDVYLNRGMFYLEHDMGERALADFDKGLQFSKDKDLYYYRGLSKLMLGDRGAACEDFKKAESMGHIEARLEVKGLCGKKK